MLMLPSKSPFKLHSIWGFGSNICAKRLHYIYAGFLIIMILNAAGKWLVRTKTLLVLGANFFFRHCDLKATHNL